MNFPLLRLELRKNRLSAASMAAAFLVTLPVSRLVATTTGMEPGRALEAILLGWLFLGTPFAAALIGADGAPARLRYAALKPKDAKPRSNPGLVHREGGRAWLVWGDSLIETGTDGTAVSMRRLRGLEDYRVVDGGLLYDDGRSLRFQGWNGTTRRLIKP